MRIQVVVDAVLREWKTDGLEAHLKKVQALYRERRDKMLEAAKEHLTGS
jgi:DNA-binding transcriptional MocR family regulator